ncbi:MAG TPA: FecR domain-containing protein [Gemmatimonadaceae bacterium]|nr:FecR domain-containing protein [Gemmatimonadaceae bacterium]
MPVTSPPMGSDKSPGPTPGTPLSDAGSLEQYFRSHFSELATEAKAQLADAESAAPRVVEGAFRHAWEERERISTAQDLDAFLLEEVRHGAAREKSRRASLHRHDAKGAKAAPHVITVDVDQSWTHLSRALHLVPDDVSIDAEQESAAMLRHDAAGHVADLAKKRSWKVPIAIGVVAAAVVAGAIWYMDRLGDEGAVTGALAAGDARTHVASTAQLAKVTLDDGTQVTLTPESKLIVPKQFGDLMRAVKLEGEATFTVVPNQKHPLEIRAGDAKALVTGTILTVRAFPSESMVVVVVKEGTVGVKIGDSTRAVGAGKAVVVKNKALRDPTAAEVEEATSWNDQTLTIANRQLRTVLPQLRRWYGLDIKVLDAPLLDRMVTMQASLDSPKEAINAVSQSANVQFAWGADGKTMLFKDAPAGKKKK